MAYSKQNFQDGQILNAANLEAMENGIIAGQGARNLLVNSNFRNPIDIDNLIGTVNANPCFTRWNFERASSSVTTQIIKIDNGIRVYKNGGVARFYQSLNYNFLNKKVSYAISTSEGIFVGSCTVSGNSSFTRIGTHTGYISAYQSSSSGNLIFSLYFNDSSEDAIDIYWAALYEGAYTADTLPNYVPKDKHVEMLNCGVPLTPHNLLDNSNFINAINQSGQTSWTAHDVYCIDRWKTESANNAANISYIKGSGITLTPSSKNYAGIVQQFENYSSMTGKVYTIAVCINNVWYSGTFTMGATPSGGVVLSNGIRIYSASGYNVLIRNPAGQSAITIQRAALYEGSYDASTLPPYAPKGKHVEMLNCGVPLTPHNLLDNSDFTNPVNQRGATIYTGAGYTIDRWKAGVSDCSMYVNAGKSVAFNTKTEGVNAYWRQYLPHSLSQLEGKTFTLAIKDTWGNTHCASGVYPTSAPSDTKSVIWINMYENVSIVLYCAKDGTAFVQLTTKKSVPIVWVALYEGAYDASTLPAYVPKGKLVEMVNCGVPPQPHNLLDNSDFRNPVNQRGVTSTAAAGYHIDRWKKENASGTVTIGNNYIAMTGTGAYWFLTQFVPTNKIKSGAVYTIALADTSGSVSVCSTVMSTDMTKFTARHTFTNGVAVTTSVEYTSDKYAVYFTSNSSAETRFAWAALYEGSYTADTLPAYQPKGYAAELAECQRYYYQSWDGSKFDKGYITREAISASSLALIEFPTEMRIVPTITFYTAANETGVVKEWTTSSSVSATQNYTSTKAFGVGGGGNFTAGKTYYFHYTASADL